MRNLYRMLISLPIAALPLLAASPHLSAAPAMRPSDAVRLLAESNTADARCHILAPSDHQQLADYVARAEVAAAQLDGAAVTRSALAAGISSGNTMACDMRTQIMVAATLSAARRAEKELGPQIAELVKKAKAKKIARAQSGANRQVRAAALQLPPANDQRHLFSLSGSGGALDLYTRHAAAYYIERRCRFLASSDTMAFWKLIVMRHNAMIARFGGAAVTVAKATAADYGSAACDGDSKGFVRAAWNDMQRYR